MSASSNSANAQILGKIIQFDNGTLDRKGNSVGEAIRNRDPIAFENYGLVPFPVD